MLKRSLLAVFILVCLESWSWAQPGVRVAGIGDNTGIACASQIFASGDLPGSFTILTAAAFNALSVADLRSNYDVLIFTWDSDPGINADWSTRLLPYLDLGGGVIFEDSNNVGDLAPAIVAQNLETGGAGISLLPVPGLTDGITTDFVNSHIRFTSWDPAFSPFIVQGSDVIGLWGSSPGGGRIVLTGPDQHYHGDRGGTGDKSNQYNLLLNEVLFVTQAGVGDVQLTFLPSELTPLPQSGWYGDNPVTLEATLNCPTGGPDCPFPFNLEINSPNGARFYFLGSDTGTADVSVECLDAPAGGDYSHQSLLTHCIREGAVTALTLFAGETKTVRWSLWVQPSDVATLSARAVWGTNMAEETLAVARAEIHPAVFVHGIQGSQPPRNSVVEQWPQQAGPIIDFSLGPHLDPFVGSYKPLIDNLLKMGYEMKRTLFPVTYDWRQSNINSAAHLRFALNTRVGAYGVSTLPDDVRYANRDGKADVIVHSMGGLVLRTYIAGLARWGDPNDEDGLDYQGNVLNAIFIATPHRGFPFDYETLHGMTWKEYTDEQVAAQLGGLIAPVLSASTDRILWPYLIMCRYRADWGQPCNNPEFDLLGCNTYHSQVLYDYSRANPFDANHPGIGSLREMIPDKWSRKFLRPKKGKIKPFRYLKPEKYGREANFLLDRMGLNGGRARRSLKKLGQDPKKFDGIYVLYNRAFKTVNQYKVTKPAPLPPKGVIFHPNYQPQSRRWSPGGEPDAKGGREWKNGDGLIPSWSSRLFYKRGLLAGQLEWKDRRNQELEIDDADHVLIMTTQQTQSVIGAVLTGLVEPRKARANPELFPLHSPYDPPTQILNNLDVLIGHLATCRANPTPP